MIHVVEEFCNDLLQDHDDGDDNKFSLWPDVIVLDTQSTRTRPTLAPWKNLSNPIRQFFSNWVIFEGSNMTVLQTQAMHLSHS